VEYFGWVLAALSTIVLAVVFIYSKGWFKNRVKLPRDVRAKEPVLNSVVTSKAPEREETAESKAPKPAQPIQPDSKVVTVRIVPLVDERFNAEKLVLGLRAAAFTHGEFDIFHNHDALGSGRIRYSVASLVEPGSFDLSKLKDSEFPGVSMFMVLPAPEDGLALFDEMMACAHRLAKDVGGRLVDEQGSLFSVQRERYMREEVIEFLRQQLRVGDQDDIYELSDQ
jgi:cell division protein ZipA